MDSDGDSADFHGSAMGEYVLEQVLEYVLEYVLEQVRVNHLLLFVSIALMRFRRTQLCTRNEVEVRDGSPK